MALIWNCSITSAGNDFIGIEWKCNLSYRRTILERKRPRTGQYLVSFPGAGGFDLGFRRAGFRPVLAIDLDPAAVETYRWNEPDTHVALLDIAESTPDDLVKLWISINGDKGPVGIIGGPPCQAFSVSNVYQRRERSQAQASR